MQVYAMPVYDMIEYQIIKISRGRVPNGFFTRLVYRTIYIILVAFVAMTLPFFGGTVNSFCNNCFGYQEICPYIELSLLRGTTAVRMQ